MTLLLVRRDLNCLWRSWICRFTATKQPAHHSPHIWTAFSGRFLIAFISFGFLLALGPLIYVRVVESTVKQRARRRGQQRRRWERKNNKIGANRTSKKSEFLLCTVFLRLYVFNIQKNCNFDLCALLRAVREGKTRLKVVRSVNLCEIQRGSFERQNCINEAEN